MSNIKMYRKMQGYTQSELATKIGVSQQTIAKWESGNAFPLAGKLPEIAKILSCTIDDLLSDNKEVKNGTKLSKTGGF